MKPRDRRYTKVNREKVDTYQRTLYGKMNWKRHYHK